MKKDAVISACKKYRYVLQRSWDKKRPPLYLCLLNPSTADEVIDDSTVKRCIYRAQQMGCGSITICNLGAGRSASPKKWMAMRDPIGTENDAYLRRLLKEAGNNGAHFIAGWGAHGHFMGRDKLFIEFADKYGVKLLCLGTTSKGQPKHPLYIPYSQKAVPLLR